MEDADARSVESVRENRIDDGVRMEYVDRSVAVGDVEIAGFVFAEAIRIHERRAAHRLVRPRRHVAVRVGDDVDVAAAVVAEEVLALDRRDGAGIAVAADDGAADRMRVVELWWNAAGWSRARRAAAR